MRESGIELNPLPVIIRCLILIGIDPAADPFFWFVRSSGSPFTEAPLFPAAVAGEWNNGSPAL